MALILDTGPVFATLDRRDAGHASCRRLITETNESLIIPSPVIVEVEQLLRRYAYPSLFVNFLRDIEDGAYSIADLEPTDYARVREICDRYSDAQVGFVDAAVMAIVERLNEPKLATLDRRHFGLMRPRHIDSLRLLPE